MAKAYFRAAASQQSWQGCSCDADRLLAWHSSPGHLPPPSI